MSYLEMNSTPLPNMNKGIISLWFRDARKNKPPSPQAWPSGVWEPGTESMLPPDAFKVVTQEQFQHNVFFWNAYGSYQVSGPVTLPIIGAASVMIPSPPPFVANEMHMMLTFGNPRQSYNYCPWTVELPGVIEGVYYVPMIVTGPQWSVPSSPPPYAPYLPLGKYKVATFVLSASEPKSGFVPQSFIGVDKDGYLTICLQTNTKARYKGYAFQLDKVTEIWATATYLDKPSLQAGGKWVKVPGYWDGYQFWYTDVSNQVMGAQPETFVIGGPPGSFDFATIPRVGDGAWHHLLFSFDIGGSVEVTLPTVASGPPQPIVKTECRAWLALDGVNYTGGALQHRFPMHDGFQLPLLPGMGADIIGFGPVTSGVYSAMGLGNKNAILPRNCWIIPMRGNPKDGLPRFASTAGLWTQESTALINKGDFNWFVWTGSIWPLYAVLTETNWRGELKPPKPSNPDPKTFDVPTYECSGFNLPVGGHPIGVPTSAYHIQHNTGIEMAELQIWANRTLDTNNEKMRSLFIEDGKPMKPKKAEEVLGAPDIKLHGSSAWKNGRNSGTSATGADGKPDPAGRFVPVAGIERFLPDPQLRK